MLNILKTRFEQNPARHPDLTWAEVEQRLLAHPEALAVLERMEETGGEPDVLGAFGEDGQLLFCDCSGETPAGRCSLCSSADPLLCASAHSGLPDQSSS